jgi:hypothetical protein
MRIQATKKMEAGNSYDWRDAQGSILISDDDCRDQGGSMRRIARILVIAHRNGRDQY